MYTTVINLLFCLFRNNNATLSFTIIENSMKHIAIIGAGLSGTLLVINLLKNARNESVRIQLIDRNPAENLGPAYSTNEDYLLNVPVELMGAASEDPSQFQQWARDRNATANNGDYLPRRLYRQYIQSMLQETLKKDRNHELFERIQGEVIDMEADGSCTRILIKENRKIETDIVVLALGNSAPKNPKIKNYAFYNSPLYVRNPWKLDILNTLKSDDSILFIGSGQTMVDLATGLNKKNHRGTMTAISRRGLLPLSQKKVDAYPGFFEELRGQTRLLSIFQIVRKHMREAIETGYDIRSVIDSLRPYTINIWMQLPVDEKRRFLRHAFRYWEIIRSRIPPESMRIIYKMQSSGQFKTVTGRIIDLIQDENTVRMQYRKRGSQIEKTVSGNIVINCMGPNQDYATIDEPLIQNLVRKKIIQPDPAHLGINALPDGTVIQDKGHLSENIFTIGLTLKGIVWEALAAPEIRVQAEKLAHKILSSA